MSPLSATWTALVLSFAQPFRYPPEQIDPQPPSYMLSCENNIINISFHAEHLEKGSFSIRFMSRKE
jgi:hypothetical protein